LSKGEIIKVTSKGQITIPAKIRRVLSLDKDSYLYVTRAERLLVMRKVDELSLDEISAVLGAMAEERGVTRELLVEEAERARERLMEERDVGA
jgi:AbrB family looped-hinge helix DNA binding protein